MSCGALGCLGRVFRGLRTGWLKAFETSDFRLSARACQGNFLNATFFGLGRSWEGVGRVLGGFSGCLMRFRRNDVCTGQAPTPHTVLRGPPSNFREMLLTFL